MEEKKKMALIWGLALGLFLIGLPIFVNYAQNRSASSRTPDESKQSDQERDARDAVAKSVAGSLFLDKIAVRESSWKLRKGTFLAKMGHSDPNYLSTTFDNGEQKVLVDFSEFPSANEAAEAYDIPRSQGYGMSTKQFGDTGEKIYSQSGAFIMLRFRLGTINVTVSGTDERTAELFGRYASEAVRNFMSK